jgi:hypothetical protein
MGPGPNGALKQRKTNPGTGTDGVGPKQDVGIHKYGSKTEFFFRLRASFSV